MDEIGTERRVRAGYANLKAKERTFSFAGLLCGLYLPPGGDDSRASKEGQIYFECGDGMLRRMSHSSIRGTDLYCLPVELAAQHQELVAAVLTKVSYRLKVRC